MIQNQVPKGRSLSHFISVRLIRAVCMPMLPAVSLPFLQTCMVGVDVNVSAAQQLSHGFANILSMLLRQISQVSWAERRRSCPSGSLAVFSAKLETRGHSQTCCRSETKSGMRRQFKLFASFCQYFEKTLGELGYNWNGGSGMLNLHASLNC